MPTSILATTDDRTRSCIFRRYTIWKDPCNVLHNSCSNCCSVYKKAKHAAMILFLIVGLAPMLRFTEPFISNGKEVIKGFGIFGDSNGIIR